MTTRGRPSKFKPEFVEQARHLCKLGATDPDLANAFGVTVRTIELWKLKHEEFFRAVKVTKAMADKRVEQSLFRRAVGYEHDETDIRVVNGKVVTTEIRKRYAPDTAACIFWLKNRKREDWRDRIEAGLGGTDDGTPIPVEHQADPRVVAIVQALIDKV